jgi:hypothetical protein
MVVLGLLPPYTLDDVKACYRDKVMKAHPDRGGSAEEFNRLKEAYEQATRYMDMRRDLRGWIAARVEPHLLQQEIAEEVARRGGTVSFERFDWLHKTFGEGFALLEEKLRRIELHGSEGGDAFLTYLASKPLGVRHLQELDLSDSPVTDDSVGFLANLPLRRLNVARTALTWGGVWDVLTAVPALHWIDVSGLGFSFLFRLRLRWAFPRVQFVTNQQRQGS